MTQLVMQPIDPLCNYASYIGLRYFILHFTSFFVKNQVELFFVNYASIFELLVRTRRIMVTCMLSELMSLFRVPSLNGSNAPLFLFALEIHSFYRMCMFKVSDHSVNAFALCINLTAYLESL